MENNTEKKEVFICSCHNVEHQMVVRWDEDEEPKMVYCEIHLNELPFFKRLWNGLKYIFGHKSNYGHFQEFIFSSKDAYRLQKFVTYLKKK